MTRHTDRKGQVTSFRYDPLDRLSFQGFGTQRFRGRSAPCLLDRLIVLVLAAVESTVVKWALVICLAPFTPAPWFSVYPECQVPERLGRSKLRYLRARAGFGPKFERGHSHGATEQLTTYEREAGHKPPALHHRPLGLRTALPYDSRGNTTEIARAQGTLDEASIRMAYEARFDQPTAITDPLGRSQTITYDERGRATAARPLRRDTTLTYADSDGRPSAIRNPAGETTTLAYHGAGLASIRDPQGNQSERYSDARGRPVHETDPLGHRTAAPPILVHTRDARVSRLTPRDDTLSRLLEAPDRFV